MLFEEFFMWSWFHRGNPKLTELDSLYLEKEPNNPHDSTAVKIIRYDGRHVGYVPEIYSAKVTSLIDEGVNIHLKITAEPHPKENQPPQVLMYDDEGLAEHNAKVDEINNRVKKENRKTCFLLTLAACFLIWLIPTMFVGCLFGF